MKSKLEIGIIEGENLIKKSGMALVNNIGKTIAVITLTVAALVTFTDIALADFRAESFVTSSLMLILASYLMYFSLEDAGEKLGEESDEYKEALALYDEERKKVKGDDMDALRDFCLKYSREELEYRRKAFITSHALSLSEYEKYLCGENVGENEKKIFRRACAIRAIPLSPKTLLTKEKESSKSELISPEKYKIFRLILKLIPTTVCMCMTVSVMLKAKSGLDAAAVIEGILKLSTLPIVGFRGYVGGYSYIKKRYLPWIETKKRLLEAFNEKKATDT